MSHRYLADHERYALYAIDDPATPKALERIAAGGTGFIRDGVTAFIAAIVEAPGIGQVYRDHSAELTDLLVAHYETIISGRFLETHSASSQKTIARLFALGTDMRALFAASSFILDAFIRRRFAGTLFARNACVELSALQRVLTCDNASAFTYNQHRAMEQTEVRNARLSEQLVDFRAVIEAISGELAQASGSVGDALAVVSGAAGQALARSRSAAESTEHGNHNLTSSAAGTEELASSINELARQSEISRNVVARVEGAMRSARGAIGDLQLSAEKIGSIVDLISRIAEQTNLLSLNATIEAARAGEAGRGFAVVAQEVKALANQTTRATQDIVEQIGAVQGATARSVAEMAGIDGAMEEMARNASEVAAAISQQNGLTAELSRNLHDTVRQVVSASDGYVAAADLIATASAETERLREAVGLLSRIGAALIEDVDSFSEKIRAA